MTSSTSAAKTKRKRKRKRKRKKKRGRAGPPRLRSSCLVVCSIEYYTTQVGGSSLGWPYPTLLFSVVSSSSSSFFGHVHVKWRGKYRHNTKQPLVLSLEFTQLSPSHPNPIPIPIPIPQSLKSPYSPRYQAQPFFDDMLLPFRPSTFLLSRVGSTPDGTCSTPLLHDIQNFPAIATLT